MKENDPKKRRERGKGDANRDPITGAPGSHPVGTGLGAAAGGLAGAGAGAAIGAGIGTGAAGPVGTGIGAVAGAVAGAAGGHAVAESVNPTEEDAYWRENHARESYYRKDYAWDDYNPAYRTGYEGYSRWGQTHSNFDAAESDLRKDYESRRGVSRLDWESARPAAHAAWTRASSRSRDRNRDLENLIDADVIDIHNEKVGTLQCIWSDERGEPEFIGVNTGWFFGKTHVVPANRVHAGQRNRRIRLPYTGDQVKGAPSYDANVELTEQIENEVCRHYGIASRPALEQHEQQHRKQPATQHETPAKGHTGQEHAEIPLAEEELKIGKREVEAGGVRLRKIVKTEVVNQPVELKREEIVIERVPASEEAQKTRGEVFNEDDIYIPLRREEAVVEKETRVKEVVRARKQNKSDRREISENVRKEDVEIESTGEARRTGQHEPRSPAEEITGREEVPRSRRIK
jgi:uncharacterized protein (TIGR02271 family)